MRTARLISAQVEAEVKNRLRAPATLVALVALFVLSFLWIPDPAKNAVSIAWKGSAEGKVATGVYNASYVGAAAAVLAALFLSLIGAYLVLGSVRRDRETGVGAILAATPLPSWAYLAGKAVAHFVYLLMLGLVSVAAGILVFLRYGEGPLLLGKFVAPFLLLVVPALGFTAAVAVFFDVAPGLAGRGGQVLLFFAWTFVFLMIPILVGGGFSQRDELQHLPVFDPTGLAAFTQLVAHSMPSGRVEDISIGLMVLDEAPERVVWNGVRIEPRLILARLLNVLWVVPILGSPPLLFDRFDPARGRLRVRRGKAAAPPLAVEDLPRFSAVRLSPVACRPGFMRSVVAEARLVWSAASWLRWPLLAAALAAALPGQAGLPGRAALVLLLVPVISEVAARERLAGATALVWSQPGVPGSVVLWKAAATGLFCLTLGLPALVGLAGSSPVAALAFTCGLLFLAAFASAAGALSGGGKLFSGVLILLWYAAVSGGAELDFTGVLTRRSSPTVAVCFLAAGCGLLAIALLALRLRSRSE